MNKILSISLLCAASLAFAGCAGEEDDLFSSSAAERLEESKSLYTERLESSPAGWVMEYYPTNNSNTDDVSSLGYVLLAQFSHDGTVRMAMNNTFSNNTYLEDQSAWEIIADDGPVLSFNTYNDCIHAFCDPGQVSLPGTELGRGAEGDYEFVVINLDDNAEYGMFKGKKRVTYIRFTRLEDGTDYQAYLSDVQTFTNTMFPSTAPNMCVVTLGDSVMSMANASSGIPNIYPYGGAPIQQESYHPFLITKHNDRYYLRFRDAMNAPDGTEAQEFVYDEENDIFTGVENPEFTVAGENPATFFTQAMEDGNTWQLNRNCDMSDDFLALYDAVRTGFSAVRYTFNYLTWSMQDGQLQCILNYRPQRGGAVNIAYNFDFTQTESGATISYTGPVDNSGANVLAAIPAITDLFNAFNGEYDITAGTTKFNLTNIRLSKGDNSWFVPMFN